VQAIPSDYKGTPYKGIMQTIPGTIYARNYDEGGAGVAYCHGGVGNCGGGINCGDWPGGMALYRPDCVGLSVTNGQKPDVLTSGMPATYGEVYVSYCATGEWLKYTVEVAESGTYAIGSYVGAPGNLSVSFSFSSMPAVASGTLKIPASVDVAQPGHEMYHVWQAANNLGTVALTAGVYVMTFTIVSSQANFDTFTFTKM
jgi:hypothetical protein